MGLLGGLVVLARQDLRRGGAMFRQNMETIRGWLDKAGRAAEEAGRKVEQGGTKHLSMKEDASRGAKVTSVVHHHQEVRQQGPIARKDTSSSSSGGGGGGGGGDDKEG